MKRIKRILNNYYLTFLSRWSPYKYTRKIGVKMGVNNRIPIRHGMFGTEPYLITIGNNCLFSGEVQLLTHDGSMHVFRKDIPGAAIFKPINIGDNVFIGYRSIIMPGVTIGNNVVIGAGSLVNKNIPENSVAAGVPVKILKTYDEYKEKMSPQMDNVSGLNSSEIKEYLIRKFKSE